MKTLQPIDYARAACDTMMRHDEFDTKKDTLSLENHVGKYTPRSFIWHTWSDKAVRVQNSLKMVDALVQNDIPSEFHMFQRGGHGLSLANRLSQSSSGFGIEPASETWINLVHTWIEEWIREKTHDLSEC